MTNRLTRKTSIYRLVFSFLLAGFFVLFLIGVESISYYRLKQEGKNYPFGYIDSKKRGLAPAQSWDKGGKLSFYDPLLAFAHNPEFLVTKEAAGGFVLYSLTSPNHRGFIRIVVLGGSTTDPSGNFDWGHELAKQIFKDGINVELYNGGVAGYSSNQELLKLIRDAVYLEPDVILSLHGINDIGFIHSIPEHPLHHRYHKKISDFLIGTRHETAPFLPNSVAFIKQILHMEAASSDNNYIKGANFGVIRSESDIKTWYRNVRMMHAISAEFEIRYFSILQPVIGYGAFTPSRDEMEMIEQANHLRSGSYVEELESFYQSATKIVNGCEYCFDFTGIFEGETSVYVDPRHQSLKGAQLIATNVYESILKPDSDIH